MNMKTLVFVLLGIMFICFGTGAILMYNSNSNINIKSNSKTYNVNDEKTIDLNKINTINVKSSSYNINFIPEDRTDIKAHFYGKIYSLFSTNSPKLDVHKDGSTLIIEITNNSGFHIGSMNLKLDVYISSSYKNKISTKTASGNIAINNLSLENLKVSSASGDINIENINCDNFNGSSSSGNITSKALNTKTSEVKCTSGQIEFSNFTGNLNGNCISGDIFVSYDKFNNNVDLSTTSGEITLDVPDNSEFSLDANATSGDVSCKLPIQITGNNKDNSIQGIVKSDKNKINLGSTSGDIVIR